MIGSLTDSSATPAITSVLSLRYESQVLPFHSFHLPIWESCLLHILPLMPSSSSTHIRESKTALDSGFHAVDSGLQVLDCYPASRGYIFALWAVVGKVASVDNRSIFYRACAKFVTRFARKINHQVCRQMARVLREWNNCNNSDLLRKTHARLTQCSKPVKNWKKPVFLFIRLDFWTDLNSCRERLLFARQLRQRKCSLCSQGTSLPRRHS